MNTRTISKGSRISRVLMTALTIVLIFLFLDIMSLVADIQGTARVVNYAGLVRGTTQRIVKMEDAGLAQDKLIEAVDSYIDGLRYGSDDLDLVRLDDEAYQAKMTELAEYFYDLRDEIAQVRETGYQNTDIIAKSEDFFQICDQATKLAEDYSQQKATALDRLESIVIADIVGLLALFAIELVRALRTAALSRQLQRKVYLDEATGLLNKNKCEEILSQPGPIGPESPLAVFVFDLNNLRTINNNLGHEKGDEYIRSFALQLAKVQSPLCFTGRYGGDEFLAVLRGADAAQAAALLDRIRRNADEYSQAHPDMPISYAAGYALSSEFESPTMRELFRQADKNMYIDKNNAPCRGSGAPTAKRAHLEARFPSWLPLLQLHILRRQARPIPHPAHIIEYVSSRQRQPLGRRRAHRMLADLRRATARGAPRTAAGNASRTPYPAKQAYRADFAKPGMARPRHRVAPRR